MPMAFPVTGGAHPAIRYGRLPDKRVDYPDNAARSNCRDSYPFKFITRLSPFGA